METNIDVGAKDLMEYILHEISSKSEFNSRKSPLERNHKNFENELSSTCDNTTVIFPKNKDNSYDIVREVGIEPIRISTSENDGNDYNISDLSVTQQVPNNGYSFDESLNNKFLDEGYSPNKLLGKSTYFTSTPNFLPTDEEDIISLEDDISEIPIDKSSEIKISSAVDDTKCAFSSFIHTESSNESSLLNKTIEIAMNNTLENNERRVRSYDFSTQTENCICEFTGNSEINALCLEYRPPCKKYRLKADKESDMIYWKKDICRQPMENLKDFSKVAQVVPQKLDHSSFVRQDVSSAPKKFFLGSGGEPTFSVIMKPKLGRLGLSKLAKLKPLHKIMKN